MGVAGSPHLVMLTTVLALVFADRFQPSPPMACSDHVDLPNRSVALERIDTTIHRLRDHELAQQGVLGRGGRGRNPAP